MNSMRQLLVEQLKDLYDAEHQLLDALPKARDQASDEKLAEALDMHYEETKDQVTRLEEAFELLEEAPMRKVCQGMEGLIFEAEEGMVQAGTKPVRDLSIIAQALRIEHYEKAGYIVAVNLAEQLEYEEVQDLLEETLAEEEDAAELLESFIEETFFDKLKEAFGDSKKAMT